MTEHAPTRRWDPLVKITHWGIAAVVITNALIVGEGSIAHIYAGYTLAALLGLRLLWGFIGPTPARFGAFKPSPARALAHIGDIRAGRHAVHKSHNPLGALMVYAIWGCLLTIIGTGIAMAGPPPWDGGARDNQYRSATGAMQVESEEGEEEGGRGEESGESGEGPLGEVHETAANLLYLLILLHLAGVIFETRRSGRQVLVAMAPLGR